MTSAPAAAVVRHIPVMLQEVLHAIRARPTPPRSFLDCTFGHGGHSMAILHEFPSIVRHVAIDRDHAATNRAIAMRSMFPNVQSRFFTEPFSEARRVCGPTDAFDVVLADLGFASSHVDEVARGFSFQLDDAPLDMRYSQESQTLTAAEVINEYDVKELEIMFRAYSGERLALHIANAIAERRARAPFLYTKELSSCVFHAVLGEQRNDARTARVEGAWQSVRRVFQAIRITVNDELNQLDALLRHLPTLVADDGTLLILSFHSLEHGAVKKFVDSQSGRQAERERARLAACLEARNPGIDAMSIMNAMERDGNIKLPERREAGFTPLRVRKPTKAEIVQNRRATSAQLNISTRVNGTNPAIKKKGKSVASPLKRDVR
jgi:16S rRNA (cytosine1402-N4)-methyltransferase